MQQRRVSSCRESIIVKPIKYRHVVWKSWTWQNFVFVDFNFAPCRARRNIAILGLIHKRVLGKCHPSYDRLLPFSQVKSTRANAHNKQLYGHWCEITSYQALFNKSIFLMVDRYNFLEQSTVNAKTVSIFQSELTQIVRTRCEQHDAEWRSSFCPRGATYYSNSCAPDLD